MKGKHLSTHSQSHTVVAVAGFCLAAHGNTVVSSLAMSSGSLTAGQKLLANLRLPWEPGGLCNMDGLDMEVTMTGDVLHPLLGPDSSVALSSC